MLFLKYLLMFGGIGMIVAVGEKKARQAEKLLRSMREPYVKLGAVIKHKRGAARVEYR